MTGSLLVLLQLLQKHLLFSHQLHVLGLGLVKLGLQGVVLLLQESGTKRDLVLFQAAGLPATAGGDVVLLALFPVLVVLGVLGDKGLKIERLRLKCGQNFRASFSSHDSRQHDSYVLYTI